METKSFEDDKILRIFSVFLLIILTLIVAQPRIFAQTGNSVETLRSIGKAFAEISAKATPAVVGVRVEGKAEEYEYPSGSSEDDSSEYYSRRRFPEQKFPRYQSRRIAQGSGFIVSSEGFILTNSHLIEKSDKIIVKMADGTQAEAKVIGSDPESDIAVIKINAGKELPVLQLGDSDALEVGELVLAIGNPFGLSHTVTVGVVSAKGRSGLGISTYEDFIQTDAAINPGNSGGPLINVDGKAVGINTAMVGSSGNIGIGLVIPINMAKAVYQQLIKGGKVIRGFLGVGIQDLTPKLATSFSLKPDARGVVVSDILRDSPAQNVGLKQGDVVVELDGRTVEKVDELRYRIAMLKPGTIVKVTVLRGQTQKIFTVELGQIPKQARAESGQSNILAQLGLTVDDLTDEIIRRFGYEGLTGVVVTDVEPESLSSVAGIIPGTLIQEVNNRPVNNTKDFYNAAEKAAKGGSVVLLTSNGHISQYIALSLSRE